MKPQKGEAIIHDGGKEAAGKPREARSAQGLNGVSFADRNSQGKPVSHANEERILQKPQEPPEAILLQARDGGR